MVGRRMGRSVKESYKGAVSKGKANWVSNSKTGGGDPLKREKVPSKEDKPPNQVVIFSSS